MTIINGANHHNVDDLLASIRTSIADEMGSQRLHNNATQSTLIRRDTALTAEAADFELPAIFKPGHQTTADKPNLFGRLSDALKPQAGAEPERSRTVIRFEPAAAGRMIEPPAQMTAARNAQDTGRRADEPNTNSAGVKREMATFFDTRMNKMGETPRAAPVPRDEPQPAPMAAAAPPPLRQPPVLPEGALAPQHNSAIDDVAAQLLRPILKQWLSDNMPKIVEKALRSEASDDNPPVQPPRKTFR